MSQVPVLGALCIVAFARDRSSFCRVVDYSTQIGYHMLTDSTQLGFHMLTVYIYSFIFNISTTDSRSTNC